MVADTIRLLLFPAMMAFAASSDLFTMTISNRVSLILVGGFFVMAAVTGMSVTDAFWHVAAAATALWLGFDHLMPYLLYASLLGGALTLLLVQFRMMPLPQALARQEWIQRLHRKDGDIPYG